MADRKNILLISPAYSPISGGLSEQATLLAESLVAKGHSVKVVTETLGQSLPQYQTVKGVNIERIRSPKKRNFIKLILLSYKLGKVLINGNGRYDLCIIRTITSQALVAGILKSLRLVKYKTVITAETGGDNDEIQALAKLAFSKVIIYFLGKNDFINSNNNANYKHYKNLGFSEKKLTKIYNGIDITEYEQSKYPKSVNSFVFLSELNREKGVRELLRAFKLVLKDLPKTKLFIGGYGKEELYIKNYIKTNKLSGSVSFEGYVEKKNKRKFFEKGDCFVFPSHSEGYGLVVAEAVLYKRAVISTKVADMESIYGNNISFCAIKDVSSLKDAIVHTVKTYNSESINYDQVVNKLDIKKTAEAFTSLID